MTSVKEGGSTTIPPLFDGSNYGYVKVRITSFIRSIDEAVWSKIEDAWKALVGEEGMRKSRDEWTPEELIASNMNQKALNAIHNVVIVEVFTLISTCQAAQEACNILKKIKGFRNR